MAHWLCGSGVEMDAPANINVGKILAIHGTSGGVRIQVLSDVPHRFDAGKVLHIGNHSYKVSASKPVRSNQLILTFNGVGTLAAAQPLVGHLLTIPATEAPKLPDGEYFHFQLLGLRVVTEEGEGLGQISEIMETGSNDVYVVSGSGPELLVPALAEVIQEIQLDQGLMVVRLPDGLR